MTDPLAWVGAHLDAGPEEIPDRALARMVAVALEGKDEDEDPSAGAALDLLLERTARARGELNTAGDVVHVMLVLGLESMRRMQYLAVEWPGGWPAPDGNIRVRMLTVPESRRREVEATEDPAFIGLLKEMGLLGDAPEGMEEWGR